MSMLSLGQEKGILLLTSFSNASISNAAFFLDDFFFFFKSPKSPISSASAVVSAVGVASPGLDAS